MMTFSKALNLRQTIQVRRKIASLRSPSPLLRNNTSVSAKVLFSTTSKSDPSSSYSSSVSKDEVIKFSSMASTWWKVEHNPLISMNPTRMSFITNTLAKSHSINLQHGTDDQYEPLRGLKALDVGCGGGLLSESLARLGADVTAIDPSADVAKAAQIHSQLDERTQNIDYRGGMSVEDLATIDDYRGAFDIVCILEVIEHATDPKSLMKAAVSLLKKGAACKSTNTNINATKDPSEDSGGTLFVSTINRTVKSFAIAIVGGEYVTGKLPIGTHSWNKFLSPDEVNRLVKNFGLEEVDKKGMILRPPFHDLSWYLDDGDFDVNWIGAYRNSEEC